jgi:hypothetical protein
MLVNCGENNLICNLSLMNQNAKLDCQTGLPNRNAGSIKMPNQNACQIESPSQNACQIESPNQNAESKC